jgi:hypothetical protein
MAIHRNLFLISNYHRLLGENIHLRVHRHALQVKGGLQQYYQQKMGSNYRLLSLFSLEIGYGRGAAARVELPSLVV